MHPNNTAITTTGPLLVQARVVETLTGDRGGTIALLADSATTGGATTCNGSTFRAGADGAPPHFHTRASEFFVVLSGGLQVLVDDRVHVLDQGDV